MKQKCAVILTGPGFEDSEVIYPYYRLKENGLKVEVATSNDIKVIGKYGVPIEPTIKINMLDADKFDIVIIPGGLEAPDRLRQNKKVLDFISKMHKDGKLISSICHGPWVLVSAKIMKGKKATCYIGMKDDLIHAGAIYTGNSVTVDNNIITSDHPRHLDLWMKETIKILA